MVTDGRQGKPVAVPRLGESITEAILLRWMKEENEWVQIDEPLCELETDKATVELPSPLSGRVHHLKQAGEAVKIGENVAMVNDQAAPAQATKPPSASDPRGASAPKAESVPEQARGLSPSVRRLVAQHHIDPVAIEPTGPRGRLTKSDVLEFLEDHPTEKAAPSQATRSPGPITTAPAGAIVSGARGVRRVGMTAIRKRTAERLVKAQNEAAILTTFNEVDMSAIGQLRSRYKERFEKLYGVGLGYMSFFARAVVLGLKEYPMLNAFIDGSDMLYHDFVHLGVAVSTDRGLFVPVVKNADQLSFAETELEIRRLAALGREGKLGIDDLSGGTFTITNGGVFGSLLSTPLLNPPQTGILGMHSIVDRPKAGPQGQVEVRPLMYVALSYDHRLVDGKDSVRFLVRVKECLEDPSRLMLEV